MKKISAIVLLIATSFVATAQETTAPASNWTKKGTFTFMANQSTFDNWQAGGQSNLAGNIGVNYDFNLKKETLVWDNKLMGSYGLNKIKGQDTQKSDDRFEFNSLLGKKAKGFWYYSMFLNFKTQFTDDLKDNPLSSEFMAPAYLQIGPGMLWKKSDDLKINIAPATGRFVFVMKDELSNIGAFGVDKGENVRTELGASVSGYYKFKAMENISVENILNLYSNYLEDAQNVDVDYQLNIVMKINKYFTTNFAYQTIYDDNAFRGLQTRQVIGLGLNFNF